MDDLDAFADLREAARRHAIAFAGATLAAPPRRRLTIVTCMDARIDLFGLFGLEVGDAQILRNAGARVTGDVLRSLMISTAVMGVQRIAVVHHTDCGAHGTTNDALRAKVLSASGHDPATVDFLTFADQLEALHGDVARLAAEPCLPNGVSVAGFVYDVGSGELTQHTETLLVGTS